MPVFLLGDDLAFPPPELASREGIVAIGGDPSPERLLLAYGQGIFPWPVEGMPLPWFSPDPRFVLFPAEAHVGRSLRRTVRRDRYRVAADERFADVIAECARAYRPGQDGTWITDELADAFVRLHELGYAHSIEAYEGERLVGGLYGVSLGAAFFGESMFASAPDASKVAFVTLVGQALRWGFRFVDCQVETDHLARFGARPLRRGLFLDELREALASRRTHRGRWRLELGPAEALDAIHRARGRGGPTPAR